VTHADAVWMSIADLEAHFEVIAQQAGPVKEPGLIVRVLSGLVQTSCW